MCNKTKGIFNWAQSEQLDSCENLTINKLLDSINDLHLPTIGSNEMRFIIAEENVESMRESLENIAGFPIDEEIFRKAVTVV